MDFSTVSLPFFSAHPLIASNPGPVDMANVRRKVDLDEKNQFHHARDMAGIHPVQAHPPPMGFALLTESLLICLPLRVSSVIRPKSRIARE
jgi:hypothetical protein